MSHQLRDDSLNIASVNGYLAHKQHLAPAARLADEVLVTRDILALHATSPTGPYLSLWARSPCFQPQALENALYRRRQLAKLICMRKTLHVLSSDELPFFFQAYAERHIPGTIRDLKSLVLQAGVCQEEKTGRVLKDLQHRVMDALVENGPCTVPEICQAVPELNSTIRHSVGKPYEGEFSLGSRLVPGMCTLGLLIRTQPRGTWRSNLYEYAALSYWLPDIALDSVTPGEAQNWLVRRYLSTFGPCTFDDIRWWTGFSKRETNKALRAQGADVVEVTIERLHDRYLMLADDVQRLRCFAPPETHAVFFLPGLDPYIMGYRDRRRFLASDHSAKVFDRAGNAMPTVWANGQVVGAWGQRKDGTITCGLFEPLNEEEQALVDDKRQELEGFLDGEFVPQRTHTPFTRALK